MHIYYNKLKLTDSRVLILEKNGCDLNVQPDAVTRTAKEPSPDRKRRDVNLHY